MRSPRYGGQGPTQGLDSRSSQKEEVVQGLLRSACSSTECPTGAVMTRTAPACLLLSLPGGLFFPDNAVGCQAQRAPPSCTFPVFILRNHSHRVQVRGGSQLQPRRGEPDTDIVWERELYSHDPL